MKCDCDPKFAYQSITPLPSDSDQLLIHVQTNCLNCGSGWGEVRTVTSEEE